MAHEIERRNGVDQMAYVKATERDVPWHGLGQPLEFLDGEGNVRRATGEEILVASGTDWEVGLNPVFTEVAGSGHSGVVDGETGTLDLFGMQDALTQRKIELPGTFAVLRSDDHKPLGVVGDWYQPFQNREIVRFGEQIVDEIGANWETGMSLRGGKQVAYAMKLPEGLDVLGDDHYDLYLLLTSSHDGSAVLQAALTAIRAVCKNTVDFGLASAASKVRIRHVGSELTSEERVNGARQTLQVVTKWTKEFAKVAESMAQAEITLAEVDALVAELGLVTNVESERGTKRLATITEQVRANLLHSPTISDDLRMTKYGAFNAITEWAEWVYELKSDSRVERKEQKMLARTNGGYIAKIREKAYAGLSK